MPRYENPPYYLSAYGLAVKRGYQGGEAEWLASLKGETGPQGPQGIQGEKGDRGDRGSRVELREHDGKLQWRWAATETEDPYPWHELADVSDLKSQMEESYVKRLVFDAVGGLTLCGYGALGPGEVIRDPADGMVYLQMQAD